MAGLQTIGTYEGQVLAHERGPHRLGAVRQVCQPVRVGTLRPTEERLTPCGTTDVPRARMPGRETGS